MRSSAMPRRCSAFSAAAHRFQPGGLLAPVTDGSRGMVTTFPSLVDGAGLAQPAHGRACQGRSMWRAPKAEASVFLARACEGQGGSAGNPPATRSFATPPSPMPCRTRSHGEPPYRDSAKSSTQRRTLADVGDERPSRLADDARRRPAKVGKLRTFTASRRSGEVRRFDPSLPFKIDL